MTVKVELSEPYMGKHNEKKNVFVKLIEKKPSAKYGTVYIVQDKSGRKGLFFNFTYKQIEPKIKDIEINDCFLMSATCKHSQSNYDGLKKNDKIKFLENVNNIKLLLYKQSYRNFTRVSDKNFDEDQALKSQKETFDHIKASFNKPYTHS